MFTLNILWVAAEASTRPVFYFVNSDQDRFTSVTVALQRGACAVQEGLWGYCQRYCLEMSADNDQSIECTVSDGIVLRWLGSTTTGSFSLGHFSKITELVDNLIPHTVLVEDFKISYLFRSMFIYLEVNDSNCSFRFILFNLLSLSKQVNDVPKYVIFSGYVTWYSHSLIELITNFSLVSAWLPWNSKIDCGYDVIT